MEPNNPNVGTTTSRDNGVRVTGERRDVPLERLEEERAIERPILPEIDTQRIKQALLDAKAWLEERKMVTTVLGFGLGFALGRLLRRS